VNIEEILKTKTNDPYDESFKFKQIITQHEADDIGITYDFEDHINEDFINLAQSETSEEDNDKNEEEPQIINDMEMKIEEIELPASNTKKTTGSMLKQNLKTFLEDNDEDYLLEDKTTKKVKKNDRKAVVKESNNSQPKIDTIFKKRN
jgi:hypothetical protein